MHYNTLSILNPEAQGYGADIRLDKITELAASVLDAPICLLTLIDDASDRQLFRSAVGLPVELAQIRSTPLRYSFCKHVRDSGEALRLVDAREDPLHKQNPAIEEFGVVSYLGLPLHGERGEPVGALCCIDVRSRDWTDKEVRKLTTLASVADDQFALAFAMRDQAKAELRAQQATTARASFLSHANHEVRTPLSAISGAARLLGTISLDPKSRSLADVIERNVSRLHSLTNDLIRIAELEGDKAAPKHQTLNLMDLLDTVVDAHRTTALSKRISLTLRDKISPNTAFVSDPAILKDILSRILSNAIRFTECGEVEVTVNATQTEKEILVHIRDTGVGIDEELRRRLFEEFEGHDPNTARRGGGTGLGMNIVKREVELLGGNIIVSGHPHRGTIFTICLPSQRSSTLDSQLNPDTGGGQGRLTCLECGKEMSLLRRHLNIEHGMSPEEYRNKWGLPESFEFSSAAYQEMRKRIIGPNN